ncbi:MAG: hypothetical protein FWF06_07040, partial [Symbiobacteriaceae bacterium]|nr:hypothetical protein [Symbiobacteriaceae bacterium]
ALVGWEELKRLYALPWENEKGQRVWLNLSAQGERQWGRTPDPTPKAEATEVTARETLPLVELPSLAKIESINLDLAELGILARNSREEAQNMFQNIQDNLVALRAVTTMIEQSKLALPSLTLPAEVEEKDSYRSEATALVTASPEHETRQQETINELTHKLQNAMQMSNFTSEQAVLTLKKDIGSGLRLEYQDFLQDKDMPYNETGYTSFRNSLVRIFMVLQRHGIILE